MRSKLWHKLRRGVGRHFGLAAAQVAVQPKPTWYWRAVTVLSLFLLGYAVGFWKFAAGDLSTLKEQVHGLTLENHALRAKIVHHERQLQVEQAAQTNLAKELAALQQEDMRLKEDIEFYKSMLKVTPGTASELKLQSFTVTKGELANQYHYNILFTHPGQQGIKGQVNLILSGIKGGQPISLPITDASDSQGIKIDFKYYQRVEGSFMVPDDVVGQALEAVFMASGSNQPNITKKTDLPV